MARRKKATVRFNQLEFSFDETAAPKARRSGMCSLPMRKKLYEYTAGPVRGLVFQDLTDKNKEPTISLSRVFTDEEGKAYESNHFNAEDQRLIDHVFAVCRDWLNHANLATEYTEVGEKG